MKVQSKNVFDLVISGGTAVLENGLVLASIGIRDGKIVAIFDPDLDFQAKTVLDATGKVVFPGLIDPHVHLWEPGPLNYREDFLHGTQAAAAGGVTTLIEMPLSIPPVIDKESFNLKYAIASRNSVIDFAFWGGLIPSSIDNLEQLHQLGCVGFKAFMSYANDSYPNTPDFELWKAMNRIAKFDGLVGVHAENADIVEYTGRELEKAGIMHAEAHSDGRPEIGEIEAVQRAILFAEHSGCRLYIVHMTSAEAVDMVKRAKERGVRIWSETCHHYLLFDRSALSQFGTHIKCNPPLRSKENLERLWEQILQGNIDTIGSDHGPYTDAEKTEHGDNIWKAPSGFGGIELILPIMISEGYHKRNLGLESIARLTSTNAAKIFGIYPQKGTIRIGSDADFAIVDLDEEWTYNGKESFSKTKSEYSPYHNQRFKGKVKMTLVRGMQVYEEKAVKVQPGYGRFITAHR